MQLNKEFWEKRYADHETGWDIGHASPPLREFIDGVQDKDLRILIPGAGNAYEAEHAHRSGFTNVTVIDLAAEPLQALKKRSPDFPDGHLKQGDFFQHEAQYDVILEQTFFCALDPALRPRYVQHMHHLLAPGGKLVGVLFNDALNTDKPPFGGSVPEYEQLFKPMFPAVTFEACYNSIGPRAGREVWLKAVKDR